VTKERYTKSNLPHKICAACGLRPSVHVAQEVGARLGYGENLFRTLQGRPAPENAWVLSAR
jgi:ribosomal protein L37E